MYHSLHKQVWHVKSPHYMKTFDALSSKHLKCMYIKTINLHEQVKWENVSEYTSVSSQPTRTINNINTYWVFKELVLTCNGLWLVCTSRNVCQTTDLSKTHHVTRLKVVDPHKRNSCTASTIYTKHFMHTVTVFKCFRQWFVETGKQTPNMHIVTQ
jgi:hypothetical protein